MRKIFLISSFLIMSMFALTACGNKTEDINVGTGTDATSSDADANTDTSYTVGDNGSVFIDNNDAPTVVSDNAETDGKNDTVVTTEDNTSKTDNKSDDKKDGNKDNTKPSTEQAAPTTQPTQPEAPTQPQHTNPERVQPAHTHNFVGGDCTHPSTCECGATGRYGSHNWNTRTWTEQIIHEGETVTTYKPGARCGECGLTGTVLEVDAHQDSTGHMGYTGYEIPVTTTTAPWTETVNHSETTCFICGARQ